MANPIVFAPALSKAITDLLSTCIPTDEQAQKPSKRGRKAVSTETILSVVVEKLRTGHSWATFSKGQASQSRFTKWSESGALHALWWVITRNPAAYGFCDKRLWAATTFLIQGNHITGPSENWLGPDFVLPRQPKPEMYGPKQEKKQRRPIWNLDDRFMQRINPILEEAFPLTDEIGRGRPRLPMSKVFNGLLFQIRTGIQWEQMPARFGHYSTIHRWKTKMHRAGVFYKIMALFILEADSLGLIDWSVQALDGSYAKARLGGDGIGQNPTDRAKSGIKRSVLSDSTGMPLAVFVAGANIHDSQLVEQTLAARVKPKNYTGTQVLLLDRGYRGQTVKNTVESHGYEYRAPAMNKDNPYHILDQEYTLDDNRQRAAVEWSHSYMQQYRTVMTRFSRKARNYEADCVFACFMISYGRILDKLAVD